jgi:hypothetical protein
MKSFKFALFFVAITCVSLSCKKNSDDSGSDCEDTHMTKVTFTNKGSVPLRVEVAIQLTPQFKPITPVVTLDLAPGASVVKEFIAGKYFNVWSSNCAASCSMVTYYNKTYVECSTYEEKQGF